MSLRNMISAGILIFCVCPIPSHAIEEGDPLPAFILQDMEGNDHTERTHTGQILILYFFGHD